MRLPSKPDSTALVATKKKAAKKVERKCYVCRKPGHIAKGYGRGRSRRLLVMLSCHCGCHRKEQWIADSGASAHRQATRPFLDFKNFPPLKPVYVRNSNTIMAYGQGP
ncbi:hypothetical protein AVEN_85754-1 [Araneus ventricosus]|uniref:CCHC-type domain-containing protein n=1 Tax=Araneus ventricosus TaxID=182803 RepID=A0A4Y1ZTC4_ARAVE|nr:hypothetical protein AVEN_85754-1 [Araneus ventricosus]